jgi:hypothetical protein
MKMGRKGGRAKWASAHGINGLAQGIRRRMAKRDRYSRWRRLPPVFWSGEHRIPGPESELQRIILYLKGEILDQAEVQAEQAGAPTIQDYCAELLARAIEIQRVKRQVAQVEARRGPLEGLSEISEDPEYLAEWRRRFDSGEGPSIKPPPPTAEEQDGRPELIIPLDSSEPAPLPVVPEALLERPYAPEDDSLPLYIGPDEPEGRPQVRIERTPLSTDRTILEPERIVPEVLDRTAVETVFLHVGSGDFDPDMFLATLRRGQDVRPESMAELLDALSRIEADHRGATALDRRLSYALYRLALEAQVLITEAWPGVFKDRTIGAIREVQEMVERILSGVEPSDRADHGERREGDQ